jgi:hypothetical protein
MAISIYIWYANKTDRKTYKNHHDNDRDQFI